MDSGFICSQDSPSDINLLEQNFSQLSAEGQSQLKDYLQSLVSLQNAITKMDSADNVHVSLNGNQIGN
jgi:hypothetical protein